MSYFLRKNGEQIAVSGGWNPRLFGQHTGTSFPASVPHGWSWEHDGWSLAWEDDPEPEQPAQVTPPRELTSLEFLDLFTEAEQLTVATAAMQSPQVKLWYDRTLAAMFITLADPRTEAGLTALVDAGMLTAERKAKIVEAMR